MEAPGAALPTGRRDGGRERGRVEAREKTHVSAPRKASRVGVNGDARPARATMGRREEIEP